MIQLVMSHVGTDFDGLASMVLAQKLYPGSHLVFPGRKGTGVGEFYDLHKRQFPSLSNKEALSTRPDRLIVVDTRTPSRLGDFRPWFQNPEVELHIYDHHPATAESVRGDQEWVEEVGAAATLLVEQCRKREIRISCEEASLALIAIHEETGSFRYSSTTARDLEAAAHMMVCGANLEVLAEFLKEPLTQGQRELLEEFLKNGELLEGKAGRLYLSQASRKRSVFGLGALASRILDITGADAVCTVLEAADAGTSIAGRASSEAFDLASWMAHWGGGGHRKAAAASQVSESADAVMEELRGRLHTGTTRILTAGDLMSRELFNLDINLTVAQSYEELKRRGYNSAFVLDEDGSLEGLVSRSDLSKALDHQLGHAPAKSVMTHKVLSVDVNDSLDQVRRMIVERQAGSLPVLEDGELVGIVTRSDLLREMYQATEESAWESGSSGARVSLADTSEPYLTWLKTASDLAQEQRMSLYAVGGFVRDLLLERASDDLDLVVEGDAIELARQVAKKLQGKLITHEKYLTACIKFKDGSKLDLASARREVYVRPAALPEVAESKLKSDLYRRDFTINAIALKLDEGLKGTLVDFFGGRKDLEGKWIRVLHNHSFLDDPTRILRAVRFEQRLGFAIEPHTTQLIRSAIEANIFTLAHGERLAEEFRLSLSEHDPVSVLSRLEKLKVLKAIHPELKFHSKISDRISRALDFMQRYPELVPRDQAWLVPLTFFGLELSDSAREALRERFSWRLANWPIPVNDIVKEISRSGVKASLVAEILDRLTGTQVTALAAISTHATLGERISHYVEQSKSMVPLLRGSHILEHGIELGPSVSEWKKKAYAAQRDGEFINLAGAQDWLRSQTDPPHC